MGLYPGGLKSGINFVLEPERPYIRVGLYSGFYGNFLSSVPVSDWLIFCCGNSILHQKKRNENDKNSNFLMKNKKVPRKYM